MASTVRFGSFEVDLDSGQLYKRGMRIHLREQSFQVLASLLEHPGEVVTRAELHRRLWPNDVFVDFDNSLNTAVARLRESLSDSAEHPRFIETLPKRGYRFLATVSKGRPFPEGVPARRARLVVLPFVNLSGDPTQEYFSDAMTEEIITALANVAPQQLAVIARTTSMHYKTSHKDAARIGRELGVDYILEGSVRRSDDHVGINTQLIHTSDQAHVFARRFEGELCDVYILLETLAQAIALHIPRAADQAAVRGSAGTAPRKSIRDVSAYNAYIKGRYHLLNKSTPEDVAKAKRYFEEALARDPQFALAYDGLAELYWFLGFFGLREPRGASSEGLFYALRAVEIDNTLAQTHALIAMYRKNLDYNWGETQREITRALELDPTSPIVRVRHAQSYLLPQGRLPEAIAEIERALEADPLSLTTRVWLGVILWLAREFDRAHDEAQSMIEIDPSSYTGYMAMGLVQVSEQVFEEAIPALRKAACLSGNSPMVLGWLGLALAQSGKATETENLLKHLHILAEKAYVPPTSFAWVHLGRAEMVEAFDWMDRAIDVRDPMMIPVKTYPFLDPFRADPRFAALLQKMNL